MLAENIDFVLQYEMGFLLVVNDGDWTKQCSMQVYIEKRCEEFEQSSRNGIDSGCFFFIMLIVRILRKLKQIGMFNLLIDRIFITLMMIEFAYLILGKIHYMKHSVKVSKLK